MDKYLYVCDPKKNTVCRKTACHINGGPCSHTTNKQYKKAGTKRVPTEVFRRETKKEARTTWQESRTDGSTPQNSRP